MNRRRRARSRTATRPTFGDISSLSRPAMAHRAASSAPSMLSHLVSRRWSADERKEYEVAYAQRLISTRRGAVFLSAFAAILAGIHIVVYVQKYRNSVSAEGGPVTVLVAK